MASLVACSADDPRITAGTCLAEETPAKGRSVPDLSSVVPCTSPHRYEVYDVLDLPASDDLAQRAQDRCATSLLRVTEYASLKVNGKAAPAIDLVPALRGIQAPRFVISRSPLVADRRQVVCAARTTTLVKSAKNGGLLVALAKTSAFPVALRPCRAYDAKRQSIVDVPCSRRHVTERLFTFDASKALGRRFVADLVREPTAERFDQLDRICTQALPQLLGKRAVKGLRGFGSVARRWTDTSKPVRCDVGPANFRTTDLSPGSLVGTERNNVKLLPVPQRTPSVA
jgi:hypothetical protein